ncbi:hypothetical protein [Rugosimonospora africana]|uniref:Uncharacterized protein n=1 Tax=Rugosimonospora africana TaxID=556532 RepID=A0A8J3QRV1_9ACTN|nr:hypothetical protein [Rugosimonospora africana]GIH16350.1 hypothetical protein Raf01_45220 [Rugosimonospora africana]
MYWTVIGVWHEDRPVVVGVVPGRYEVYGGDEEVFPDGLWYLHISAADIREAEMLAKAEIIANGL